MTTSPDAHLARSNGPRRSDPGITALEAVAGITVIATIVALAVWASFQFAGQGTGRACGADARMLATATDVYFARTGSTVLPATGDDHDRYERTLVEAELLGDTSVRFDLQPDGGLVPSGDDCE
ncbi:MAG: hypothetical protein AAGD33_05360 [Actinomycetota bacterium]